MNGFRHSDDKGPKRVCPFASVPPSLSLSLYLLLLSFHPKNFMATMSICSTFKKHILLDRTGQWKASYISKVHFFHFHGPVS